MRMNRNVMILFWIAIAAWPTAAARAQLLEWTEGWESGKNHTDWTYHQNEGYWTVTDTGANGGAPEGSYYMLLPGPNANGKEVDRLIGSADSPYEVSYYTQTFDSGSQYTYDGVYIVDANGGLQISLKYWNDGTNDLIRVRNDSTDTNYTLDGTGVWHLTDLLIYPDSVNGLTYDLYVDGSLMGANLLSADTTVAAYNPSADLILHHGVTNSELTRNYIDDIVVASYTVMHPGDANLDGMVNLADLQILGDNWQSTTATWSEADFTGDNAVNLADLQIIGDNWGYGTTPDLAFDQALLASGVIVPEPMSLGLLLVGSVWFMGRRRS